MPARRHTSCNTLADCLLQRKCRYVGLNRKNPVRKVGNFVGVGEFTTVRKHCEIDYEPSFTLENTMKS